MDTFSKRNCINIEPVPITIKYDAPQELRMWLFDLVKRLGFSIKAFRGIVCQVSFQTADPNNWGENSYMESEIMILLENCRWNCIYDIIEAIYEIIPQQSKQPFCDNINNFFLSNGYGWKLENGQVLSRGDEAFELSVNLAIENLNASNPDACNEIKEAITDISKRPDPDITGAVQHSMAALECFCRRWFNDEKPTLGKLIENHRYSIQPPLDQAITALWGFASERGRHLKEGKPPSFEDAELTVHICASIITFFKRSI